MRCFVALIPPPEASDHLDEFLEVRRPASAFRWTRAEQFHLTLAFAAEAADWQVDELTERLAAVAERHRPLTLRIRGGGAFPHADGAKVLWAGLETDDPERLDRLAASCRGAVSQSGVEVDGARFRAHLTVARSGRPMQMTNWVRLLDAYEGPAWTAESLTLVQSHLGEGPRRRPRYETLAELPLAGS